MILASNVVDQLIAEGHALPGSRVDLVRSGVAIAVRSGAPRPDIGSEDAVRNAVRHARSVSYSTGPSGDYLAKLFERWGIAAEIASRIVKPAPGIPVGKLVAEGSVELGFQQLSELMFLPGIDVVGPAAAGDPARHDVFGRRLRDVLARGRGAPAARLPGIAPDRRGQAPQRHGARLSVASLRRPHAG